MYVIFEGVDGSGKSTAIDAVASLLRHCKVGVIKTREPGGTAFGESIRELILHSSKTSGLNPISQAMMLAAGSYSNSIAEYKGSTVVLSDRWAPISSLVYQGIGLKVNDYQKLSLFWNNYINYVLTPEQKPDLIIYLDLPSDVAHERASKRGGKDNIDSGIKADTALRAAKYAEVLARDYKYNIPVLRFDATVNKDQLATQIFEALNERLVAQ